MGSGQSLKVLVRDSDEALLRPPDRLVQRDGFGAYPDVVSSQEFLETAEPAANDGWGGEKEESAVVLEIATESLDIVLCEVSGGPCDDEEVAVVRNLSLSGDVKSPHRIVIALELSDKEVEGHAAGPLDGEFAVAGGEVDRGPFSFLEGEDGLSDLRLDLKARRRGVGRRQRGEGIC
jgi:hypothetical protein